MKPKYIIVDPDMIELQKFFDEAEKPKHDGNRLLYLVSPSPIEATTTPFNSNSRYGFEV